MKNLLIILVLGLVMSLGSSCENEQILPTEDIVVVQAYLYAGEPVDDIFLSKLLPYSVNDTQFTYVEDAEISITWKDQSYSLVPSGDPGYYHYPGEDLLILEGQEYSIQFQYVEEQISAVATVPPPPQSLAISNTYIEVNEDLAAYSPREFIMSLPQIELTWEESGTDYFYVLLENIETNPVNIDFNSEKFRNFSFISKPVQTNNFTLLPLLTIKQFGTHLIRVFRVNQEYADLYESIDQDSRYLNEPLSNINNGLGIFSAFNCDSVYFEVIRENK